MMRPALWGLCVVLISLPALARDMQGDIARIRQLEHARTGADEIAGHLKSEHMPVRRAAALALARIEAPGALAPLRLALADTSHLVRRIAAFGIGQLGLARKDQSGELALLVRLAEEKHPAVRLEIWRALGRFGGSETVAAASAVRGLDRASAVVAAGLVLRRNKQPAGGTPWLAAALDDSAPEVRTAALYAFSRSHGELSRAARVAAARSLSGEQAAERDAAVRVLARGTAGVAEAVLDALWSEGLLPQWRAALVRGLARDPANKAALKGVMRQALTRPVVGPGFHMAYAAAKGIGGDSLLRREVYTAVAASSPPAARRKAALLCALGGFCAPLTAVEQLAIDAKAPNGREAILRALSSTDRALVATAATLAAGRSGAQLAQDDDLKQAVARTWPLVRGDMESGQDVLRAAVRLEVPGVDKMLVQAADADNLAMSRLARAELDKRDIKLLPRPRLTPRYDPGVPDRFGDEALPSHAVIQTDVGEIELELTTRWAPRTVANFVTLGRKGFYDGLSFHRVVVDFVAQAGDPRGDGWGGPGYTIRCENNPKPYTTGTVGMALAGKDTGGSQWFITHSAQPHLLGTYTVFAQVSGGQRVVDTLAVGDRILSITFK
ncbi:MAG: cyclophilin family peptidyl-prolyl cis-trans isomerase [Myxococcota bacterium]|jgi:cyclophilin family peptidyl-prolyl cis-trans isomerase